MFHYESEELNIEVGITPDKAFSSLNIDQRSETPSRIKIHQILKDQERFQTIKLDGEDTEDLIKGLTQFYEIHILVSAEGSPSLKYLLPSNLLSSNKAEQEEEIAFILDEFGIIDDLREQILKL